MGSDAVDLRETARSLLPGSYAMILNRWPRAEEIRLRVGRPPGVVIAGRELFAGEETVARETLLHILERATGASLHASAPALRGGYISYQGLRIGVCGEAVMTGDTLTGLRAFSSLSIRIPHTELTGGARILDTLTEPEAGSILIASPPGVGKTSLLRALIRRAASVPQRVAVLDERNELSATISGRPFFDLGQGSDVLIGVPKSQGAMMALRGLNPDIIAMDEITKPADLSAVEEIAGCGVTLFATAHGRNLEDMRKRPLYRELLSLGVFGQLVTIRLRGEGRVYERAAL